MKRLVTVGTLVLGCLLMGQWAAHPKGSHIPTTYVVIDGPGLAHPIVFHASGTWRGYRGGAAESLVNFATRAGATGLGAHPKGQDATPMGRLGRRYQVIYFLSGSDAAVHQDLYPFAEGGAWTYTPPGQGTAFRDVFGPHRAFVGWFHVFEGKALLANLVSRGLPSGPRPIGC